MKKLLTSILAFALTLSLVGCGGKTNKGTSNNSDNNTAISNDKITEIEITSDNWQDYFEIVQEDHYFKNDFDEIYGVAEAYYLVLKDNYNLVPASQKESKVAVEISYKTTQYNYTFDSENLSYELTGSGYTQGDQTITTPLRIQETKESLD